MSREKIVLGRKVIADFPKLGLNGVVAKLDTGAYRGTLHCTDIKEVQIGGQKHLSFVPLDPTHPNFKYSPALIKNYGRAWVRVSSGHRQKRYFITTDIIIRGQKYRIEISLSNRNTMRVPVLLGRKFLRGKFIVDVDRQLG